VYKRGRYSHSLQRSSSLCLGRGKTETRPKSGINIRDYTLYEAWSGVNWADLIAAQGAIGTDFYDRSTRTIVGTMLWTEYKPVIKIVRRSFFVVRPPKISENRILRYLVQSII